MENCPQNQPGCAVPAQQDSRLGAGVVGELLDDLAVHLVPQRLVLRAQLGDRHGSLHGRGRPRCHHPHGTGITLSRVQTMSSSVCPLGGWSPMNFITAGGEKRHTVTQLAPSPPRGCVTNTPASQIAAGGAMRLEEPPYLFVQTLLQGWGSHGAGGLGFPTLESLGGQLADAAVRELDERFLDGDLAGRGAAGGVGWVLGWHSGCS